jgi:spore maturation protein CgeB
MKIALIAPRWDYGDPARGPSTEDTHFRSALAGMGHDVRHYDFMARAAELGRREMNTELLEFVSNAQPDLAMFTLFEDEISLDTIDRITRSGVKTFNWFCDDHWRFDSFSKHYAPAFSLVATTDPSALPRYNAIGYRSVVLTQWACNRYAFRPRGRRARYDVTFVGQRYGDRPKVLKALRRAGIDARFWGHKWKRGRLTHDEMVTLFSSSRINLNFSKSYPGRLWRKRPTTYQIKARPFEIAGCGGFVLTERAPDLDRYFQIGEELAVFDSIDSLVSQAEFWLQHEEERSRVANAGYSRVIADHTYDRRFEEIFRSAGLG